MDVASRPFVERDGADLVGGGDPHRIEGCNTYYLMVYAADDSLRGHVDEILDAAVAMGLNTIRTWAFNDGPDEWNALQPEPGEFVEDVLRGLDYVVEQAGQRGLRLILPFVNYWPDYGGMDQYVEWSPDAERRDEFYRDEWCRRAYRRQVRTVVERVNRRTGVPYRDDPTILAWELANEPRCSSDPSGSTLQDWIERMSGFVRSLDDNHLVAVGLEGFFGNWTGRPNPPRWPTGQGTGFVRNHETETVDLATFHLYPDHWWMHPGEGIPWIRHGGAGDRETGPPRRIRKAGRPFGASTLCSFVANGARGSHGAAESRERFDVLGTLPRRVPGLRRVWRIPGRAVRSSSLAPTSNESTAGCPDMEFHFVPCAERGGPSAESGDIIPSPPQIWPGRVAVDRPHR